MASAVKGPNADDIVLTGLSGRLPESDTIEQFAEQLFAGVDLVTSDGCRWEPGLYGLPKRSGKIRELAHFDATFFGVHAKQANLMDPQLRMLLEITHETIVDAGINPIELRGSRTGVFVGVSSSESNCEGDPDKVNGYALLGYSLAMFANRISFTFDFKGQSYVTDTGCSSSMFALTQAVEAIRAGECDAAIVAGSNLCLNPITSMSPHRLGVLSPEGRCAVFDASASGYVRSDAVVAVLVQRRGAARRVYATVRGAGVNNDGNKEQGITFPCGDMQHQLAQETFAAAGLRPQDVVYVEAHGTGTQVGDPQEVNAIAELFCKDRQKPLLLGSVKSNMGHPEPAAALCSIAKVLIAMQKGVIPGNLHYHSPNPDIPALSDGRLRVVTRNTPWDGGLVAVNSFGFGGANAHVILESEPSSLPADAARVKPQLPRLVLASGRTEEAVRTLLRHAQTHRDSAALHALMDAVHALPIPGHTHRGYCLLTDPPQEEILEIDDDGSREARPVWFVFSGMGSQWPGMGRSLLALPVFAASIERSAQVLKPYGLDLQQILTEADEKSFDDVTSSFVSITAVQVALVDVLREVGIIPNGIIGASVGEIGCAYADGALTTEQAVLCAYWRGRIVADAKLPPGVMETVGLTWEEVQKRCPSDIDLACHNADDSVTRLPYYKYTPEPVLENDRAKLYWDRSVITDRAIACNKPDIVLLDRAQSRVFLVDVTIPYDENLVQADAEKRTKYLDLAHEISGPVESMKRFVRELTADEIFVQRVNSCGVAFHSKYVKVAATELRERLEAVIPHPKPRSARWVSTSLPEEQWGSQLGQLCSAEYLVHNLVSPVRLARSLREVPARAALVEVAPHALLAGLLRRALPHAAHAPLLRRHAADAASHLLAALGKLFAAGCQPHIGRLYPPVPFPVPGGTPGLASHVRWDHSVEWSVAHFGEPQRYGVNVIDCDVSRGQDVFMARYIIDGSICFPAAGHLMLVWRTMAKFHHKNLEETCIVLEEVQIRRSTILTREEPAKFFVNIQRDGYFEVCEGGDKKKGGDVVVSGAVRLVTERLAERLAPAYLPPPLFLAEADSDLLPLDSADIYKELRLRGYTYSDIFCGIRTSDPQCTAGQLTWNDNWISFMDTMLQFYIIGIDTRALHLPTSLQRVFIDPIAQMEALKMSDGSLPVKIYRDINVIVSGGVEMRGVKTSLVPRCREPQDAPKLEKYVFVPYDGMEVSSENALRSQHDALAVSLQLVLENAGLLKVKIMEAALGCQPEELLLPLAIKVLESEPLVCVDPILFAGANAADYSSLQELGIKVTNKDVWSSGLSKTEYHVILAATVLSRGVGTLVAMAGFLAARGTLLLREPRGTLDSRTTAAITAAGFGVLSRQVAESWEYVLLGRLEALPKAQVVLEMTDDSTFTWLPQLQSAMQRADVTDSRLYLWSREWDSGILGLGTCLRGETGGRALRIFHVPGACTAFTPDAPEYVAQVQKDLAVNVLRAGVWGCYRHLLSQDNTATSLLQVEHAYVNTMIHGDLSSLRWIESELRDAVEQPPQAGTDLCYVHYASLNFRDVMLATGKLQPEALPNKLAVQECVLGMEFSGVSSRGARVMGIVPARGLATSVLCDESFQWPVPNAWSLEEAATVPVAYATAYYALVVRGRMRRSEAVLVHAGAGGVGQAAIAIALHAGCTVFTTTSTPTKRTFLLTRFPALHPENIGNSRDTSFEQMVMWRTHGRGVNLVLNSLARDKLLASARCLAEGGRFLELVKLNLAENLPLGMSVFLRNSTFHGVLLDALFQTGTDDTDRAAVVRCISEGIVNGVVRPLPVTVFSNRQLEQAFRYMADGKHIGKVAVRVREKDEAKPVFAVPRIFLRAHKSYVIVGGLGGFGLELGSWLVARGARCLVLVSRSGVRSGYQARCVRRWRQAGARVLLSAVDATTPEGARQLLRDAAQLAPVAGIFNLAAVLRLNFLDNQTEKAFMAVTKPKIDLTRALDVASRELVPDLEYFVVFSSVACGRGVLGQSNYGLANSAMERMMERRRADGLPGLAVQWGPIGEVGLVVDTMGHGNEVVEVSGMIPQYVASCLKALEQFLASPHPVLSSIVVADSWRQAPETTQDIVHSIANILGIKDPSKVSQTATLAELGLDSLMKSEARNTLEHGYDVVLRAQEISSLTFARLRELSAGAEVPVA